MEWADYFLFGVLVGSLLTGTLIALFSAKGGPHA